MGSHKNSILLEGLQDQKGEPKSNVKKKKERKEDLKEEEEITTKHLFYYFHITLD